MTPWRLTFKSKRDASARSVKAEDAYLLLSILLVYPCVIKDYIRINCDNMEESASSMVEQLGAFKWIEVQILG